jgi:hypothetical protein
MFRFEASLFLSNIVQVTAGDMENCEYERHPRATVNRLKARGMMQTRTVNKPVFFLILF